MTWSAAAPSAPDPSRTRVSSWRRAGKRNPSFETVRQIARALGMTPAMLIGADPALEAHELAHFRMWRSLSPEAQQELQHFTAFLQMKQKTKPAD